MDGCGWGPTLPHLYILHFNSEIRSSYHPQWRNYTPKIFGFKLYESSDLVGQMALRNSPPSFYK